MHCCTAPVCSTTTSSTSGCCCYCFWCLEGVPGSDSCKACCCCCCYTGGSSRSNTTISNTTTSSSSSSSPLGPLHEAVACSRTAAASSFTHHAARYGLRLFPGASMGVTSMPDSFLRLPFTLAPAQLPEAVRRLEAAWADFQGRAGQERLA